MIVNNHLNCWLLIGSGFALICFCLASKRQKDATRGDLELKESCTPSTSGGQDARDERGNYIGRCNSELNLVCDEKKLICTCIDNTTTHWKARAIKSKWDPKRPTTSEDPPGICTFTEGSQCSSPSTPNEWDKDECATGLECEGNRCHKKGKKLYGEPCKTQGAENCVRARGLICTDREPKEGKKGFYCRCLYRDPFFLEYNPKAKVPNSDILGACQIPDYTRKSSDCKGAKNLCWSGSKCENDRPGSFRCEPLPEPEIILSKFHNISCVTWDDCELARNLFCDIKDKRCQCMPYFFMDKQQISEWDADLPVKGQKEKGSCVMLKDQKCGSTLFGEYTCKKGLKCKKGRCV